MANFYDSLAALYQRLSAEDAARQVGPTGPESVGSALAGSSMSPDRLGTDDPIYGGSSGGAFGMDPMSLLSLVGQNGGGIGQVDGDLMTRNGVTMIAPAMQSLMQARRQLGLPILANVASSFRTREEQARLYQAYLNGNGNLAAKPGTSNHETGHAVDIESAFLSANPELRRWLLQNGWTNDVPGEPWHWEYGT